jgi:hypothetical protein
MVNVSLFYFFRDLCKVRLKSFVVFCNLLLKRDFFVVFSDSKRRFIFNLNDFSDLDELSDVGCVDSIFNFSYLSLLNCGQSVYFFFFPFFWRISLVCANFDVFKFLVGRVFLERFDYFGKFFYLFFFDFKSIFSLFFFDKYPVKRVNFFLVLLYDFFVFFRLYSNLQFVFRFFYYFRNIFCRFVGNWFSFFRFFFFGILLFVEFFYFLVFRRFFVFLSEDYFIFFLYIYRLFVRYIFFL